MKTLELTIFKLFMFFMLKYFSGQPFLLSFFQLLLQLSKSLKIKALFGSTSMRAHFLKCFQK